MSQDTVKHSYHLVDPSPWPILSAFAAFVLVIGGVLFMHGHTSIPFFVGLGFLLFCVVGWFADVVKEATVGHHHTEVVQKGLKIGMALFIISEAMLFAAFFWGFFDASLFPMASIGSVWPPKNITVIEPFRIPYLNTLILLLSACCVTWAHHAIREGNFKEVTKGLAIAIGLGLLFTSIQAFEYIHAHFTIKDGVYGSSFYMLTGFHGAHVLIGTAFLAVCLFRNMKGEFTETHHVGFEAAAWYWHFVDVVWLFLFVFVYWWGS